MRPIEHLPIKMPWEHDPGPEFFYRNIVHPIIPDMLDLMTVGLTIDQEAVEELRVTITDVLSNVDSTLAKNPLILRHQKEVLPRAQQEHADKATAATRTPEYYLSEFKPSDMVHRTWVMNTYLKSISRSKDCRDKWPVAGMKKYNIFLSDPFIKSLVDKSTSSQNQHVISGMRALAEYKSELWNRPREEKAKEPVTLDNFNPGSNKQMREFFAMLGIEPMEYSAKTGEASWDREAVEQVLKTTDDPDLKQCLVAFVDHSFGGIIRSNFLKAFDTYTIDGKLHGNMRVFGAKTFRPTSNSPNLLNMPSTKSIYAKPLKRCFRAPDGMVVFTADLSALEDRVIANLTKDTNKCNIFLEGLDGHSLNACGYFGPELVPFLGTNTDNVAYVKKFMEAFDNDHPEIKKFRQKSKGPTFKLAYGGYPDDHKGGVITQEIFDRYHNILYPGITEYRENYVLPTAREQGYLHLGLGCRLYTDDASKDIRTLHNSTVQFWSILTLIAVNELNHRIREEKLSDIIQVTSTIYDSIYTQAIKDADVIKWLNDNMIEVLCTKYLEDETISNEASGEVGYNWADLTKVPNGASVDDIKVILRDL
jgi:hypothetical protein